MTSTSSFGLIVRSWSPVSAETETSQRWLRTPKVCSRCSGRWYCLLFSLACNHCTTPIVGYRVHRGAAIVENGAKKSSTTRSGLCSAAYRRTAAGRPNTYPTSRAIRDPLGPRPTRRYRTPSGTRSTQPGKRVVSTVTSMPSATSRRLISWVRSEPPPAPGMAGSSKPRCSTRSGAVMELSFLSGGRDATGEVVDGHLGVRAEQVVLEGPHQHLEAALLRVAGGVDELLGEVVGRVVAAGSRGRRVPGVLADDAQTGGAGVGDGPPRRRPRVDGGGVAQRERRVRRLAGVLRRVQLAGRDGGGVVDPGDVGEQRAGVGDGGDRPQ